MIRGLFTSAASMMVRRTQQEIISNNLANAGTAGYKKDVINFRNTLDASLLINDDPQVRPAENVQTVFAQGSLQQTKNPLDFAIEGEGFFVLAGPNGNFYSRNGHFTMNESRELLSTSGLPVLGESGPIILPDGDFSVNHAGQIISDNQVVGKIAVVAFPPNVRLEKIGNNLFAAPTGVQEPASVDVTVRQGYLEDANVNPIEEMVNMIVAFRDFANNQKAIRTQDESLQQLLSALGRA